MISVINPQIVTLNTKMNLAVETAQETLGSDFNSNSLTPWLGDRLTTTSLLPQWILKAYGENPNTVMVVPIIKQYFRWLLSQDFGYGAQLNWENIRVPLYMNDIFLEALADFYFPGADFSSSVLNPILPNIRRFAVKADANYFNNKGSAQSVKYVICSLLGFAWNDVSVVTANNVIVDIRIKATSFSSIDPFKTFINNYVIPAGVVPNYKSF